jgi:hypothetical protein
MVAAFSAFSRGHRLFSPTWRTRANGGEMSRHLPAQPSLEFLKKEAKSLLRNLQQQDAAAQLTDAQHQLAREYGFASWPRLRAFVATAATHPLTGTWTLNVAKSSRHPDNAVQSATVRFDVDDDLVTIEDVTVSESGEEHRTVNQLHADNTDHTGAHGYAICARWRNARVLEWEARQHGSAIGTGTYEVSPDGRQLIATSVGRTFVFERQKPEA